MGCEKDPPLGGYEGEQRREGEKVGGRSKLSQFLLSTKKMAAEEEEERPRPHSPLPPPLSLLLLLSAREIDGFLNAPVTFIAPSFAAARGETRKGYGRKCTAMIYVPRFVLQTYF